MASRDVPQPVIEPGYLLLRVIACGVCRTDLHIVERDLPPLKSSLIPGHQIVAEIADGGTIELPVGTRVGVSWMGGVDGTCPYCRRGMENLCDNPTFTGYSVNGGYAEYVLARSTLYIHCRQNSTASTLRPYSVLESLVSEACA